jgi:hypothetical protein
LRNTKCWELDFLIICNERERERERWKRRERDGKGEKELGESECGLRRRESERSAGKKDKNIILFTQKGRSKYTLVYQL